jgi:hypothetical protein
MKMHVLTAAVLASLTCRAVLAGSAFEGSEGGDTWSRFAYGTPATATSGDRTVHLGPNSHKLNVAYGETVRFVAGGADAPERSFGWRFDVIPEGNSFDLSRVAPADFPTYSLRVYVGPDPLYAGG